MANPISESAPGSGTEVPPVPPPSGSPLYPVEAVTPVGRIRLQGGSRLAVSWLPFHIVSTAKPPASTVGVPLEIANDSVNVGDGLELSISVQFVIQLLPTGSTARPAAPNAAGGSPPPRSPANEPVNCIDNVAVLLPAVTPENVKVSHIRAPAAAPIEVMGPVEALALRLPVPRLAVAAAWESPEPPMSVPEQAPVALEAPGFPLLPLQPPLEAVPPSALQAAAVPNGYIPTGALDSALSILAKFWSRAIEVAPANPGVPSKATAMVTARHFISCARMNFPLGT